MKNLTRILYDLDQGNISSDEAEKRILDLLYFSFFKKDIKESEDWLKGKIREYEQNPREALENMLAATTDIMIQYKDNQNSKAAKVIFDNCIEHNKLFLINMGIVSPD